MNTQREYSVNHRSSVRDRRRHYKELSSMQEARFQPLPFLLRVLERQFPGKIDPKSLAFLPIRKGILYEDDTLPMQGFDL
jgi:hypothetical protein